MILLLISMLIFRLHLLHHNSVILCRSVLHADGCVSKKIHRNASASIDFDVIHWIGAMVCLWPNRKRSIFTNSKFPWRSIIWHTINSILHLSKQTARFNIIHQRSIRHFLNIFHVMDKFYIIYSHSRFMQ